MPRPAGAARDPAPVRPLPLRAAARPRVRRARRLHLRSRRARLTAIAGRDPARLVDGACAALVPGGGARVSWIASGASRARSPGFPLDDSWIHLHFARNLAEGAGFAYNPGVPVVGLDGAALDAAAGRRVRARRQPRPPGAKALGIAAALGHRACWPAPRAGCGRRRRGARARRRRARCGGRAARVGRAVRHGGRRSPRCS